MKIALKLGVLAGRRRGCRAASRLRLRSMAGRRRYIGLPPPTAGCRCYHAMTGMHFMLLSAAMWRPLRTLREVSRLVASYFVMLHVEF